MAAEGFVEKLQVRNSTTEELLVTITRQSTHHDWWRAFWAGLPLANSVAIPQASSYDIPK